MVQHVVGGDDKVYLASESGVVTVVAAKGNWTITGSHDFNERMLATPVLADGQIFIRTDAALYCFANK